MLLRGQKHELQTVETEFQKETITPWWLTGGLSSRAQCGIYPKEMVGSYLRGAEHDVRGDGDCQLLQRPLKSFLSPVPHHTQHCCLCVHSRGSRGTYGKRKPGVGCTWVRREWKNTQSKGKKGSGCQWPSWMQTRRSVSVSELHEGFALAFWDLKIYAQHIQCQSSASYYHACMERPS